MTPFLMETVEDLLRRFCSKFIRPNILENTKTILALLKIDISNRENQVTTSKIDTRFSLKYDLQQLKIKGKITDVQIETFRRGIRDFFVFMCKRSLY